MNIPNAIDFNSLQELEHFIHSGLNILTLDVTKEDFRSLLKVMAVTVKIREKESHADNVFKPLRETMLLLKSYGMECDTNITKQIDELPLKWKNLKTMTLQKSHDLSKIKEYQRDVVGNIVTLFECYLELFRQKFMDKKVSQVLAAIRCMYHTFSFSYSSFRYHAITFTRSATERTSRSSVLLTNYTN